jgi:hypothetical protein
MSIIALEAIMFIFFSQSLHYFSFLSSFFHIQEQEDRSWFLDM